jgi:hypothetical protein
MRFPVCAVLGALLVAACALSTADAARVNTKLMVLQLTDLPTGFGVDNGDYVSNAELATQNSKKNYRKLGRLTGYDVVYTKLGVTGLLGIDSFASIYKSGAGAHDSMMLTLNSVERTRLPTYKRLPVAKVLGSETRFYFVRTNQEGTKVDMYTVAWRHGPIFAEVMGGGIAGTIDPAEVVALAIKQERRIDKMLR